MEMFRNCSFSLFGFLLMLFIIGCPPPGSDTGSGGSGSNGSSNGDTPTPDLGSLTITEVGSCPYTNISSWFEVYNHTSETTYLTNYQQRTYARLQVSPYDYYGVQTFSLPDLAIQPGSYALIRGKSDDDLVNGSQVVYVVSADGLVPNWVGTGGFVELIRDGATVDFVRFGTDTAEPASAGEWGGSAAPALPFGPGNYGKSIARDGSNTDTNDAGDWTYHDFASLGGPNDITSNTDADADGIPDSCETIGSTFAGLALYDWGARTAQKDIFIHIDYMDTSDEGVTPRQEALDMVKQAFQSQGIYLHFDVGDLYDQAAGTDPAQYDLDDKSHEVPYAQGVTIGQAGDGRANLYSYKYTYMDLARKQIFHYLLFANSQEADGSGGSSGLAEIWGNDFLVSLGGWGLNSGTTTDTNLLINYQAGTIMHEFGHNLGLRHGGDEDSNYKPNYYSIMNYLYTLNGLSTIGNEEGDRFYRLAGLRGMTRGGLLNSPEGDPANFKMDYSDGSGASIDETNIVESQGLRRTGSTGVDFNGDWDTVDILSGDLNGDSSTGTLTDYDDWGNIDLFFIRQYSGDTHGIRADSAELFIWDDPVGDDRQTVYPEEPFPAHFR